MMWSGGVGRGPECLANNRESGHHGQKHVCFDPSWPDSLLFARDSDPRVTPPDYIT